MSEYYDILVSACGFLNRVRTVEVDEGESFLACTFAALRGVKGGKGEKSERSELTYFDVKVVGNDAKELLARFQDVINDRSRNVFASVRLSDLTVSSFVYQKGERKGETGYAIKTRLLAIESLAIDGNVVYRRSEDPAVKTKADSAKQVEMGQANGALEPERPEIVRLSKDDPAFEEKRQALVQAGYRWDRSQRYWAWAGEIINA